MSRHTNAKLRKVTAFSIGGFIQHLCASKPFKTYRKVFEKAGYAIMLTDKATNRYIKVNNAAADLFGYSMKELEQMTPLDLFTDNERDFVGDNPPGEESFVSPARRKDGKIITIKVQTSLLEKFNVSLISDVTDEYRIRRALELNEERLREAQRIGRFGWWEYRPETNRYIGSEEISRIFTDDLSRLSFTFQDNLNYTHPEDRSYLLTAIEEAVEKKKDSFSLTYRIITPKGKVKTVAIISNTKFDENGRLIYRYGTCQDITETQKIMDDLIAARHKAEESDKLKTTFLANFSHEIRTPLNAMMGFLNILTSMDTTEQEKEEMVKLIDLNSQRLLRLINDMIDLSRIENNSMEIKYTNVEVNGFIDAMVSGFNHELQTSGKDKLRLVPIKESVKKSVYQYIDELRLSQIFSNLVSNAIKFSDEGDIRFGYRLSQNESRIGITFFVTDSGHGIRPDRLEDIFLPFVQFWDEETPKVQGAGLGLAICRRLAELMKGRIWVESLPGKGSSFLFSFNTPVMID